MNISEHKSLYEIYGELLFRSREITVSEAKGKAICHHCQCTKANHLPGDRCSTNALSKQFRNVDENEKGKIAKALELIEELRSL